MIDRAGGRGVSLDNVRDSDALAKSLTRWLRPLTFELRSGVQVTALLADSIGAWGEAHGWRVRREVAGRASHPAGRRGYLDLICYPRDEPPVAIEIDRTNKLWSLAKLRAEEASGSSAIWVRWGYPERIPKPGDVAPIGLVVFDVVYHPQLANRSRMYSRPKSLTRC